MIAWHVPGPPGPKSKAFAVGAWKDAIGFPVLELRGDGILQKVSATRRYQDKGGELMLIGQGARRRLVAHARGCGCTGLANEQDAL